MRLYIPLILLVACAVMLIGQTIHVSDLDNNQTRDIYDFTESTLNWNFDYNITNYTGYNDLGTLRSNRIKNVLYKFVDFLGFTSFEASKSLVEFGYTNPQYDFNFFLKIIGYYLILSIILLAIPVLIPVLVLVCLIGIVGYKMGERLIKYIKQRKCQKKN